MHDSALAGGWRSLTGRLPPGRILQSLFWRLPYDCRRFIVRVCHLNVDVPQRAIAHVLAHKALFIHVPKTAGISVQHSLFGGLVPTAHRSFRQYELVLSREQLASVFKFTFVRNPWDRLLSAWTYLREGGNNDQDRVFFSNHLAAFPDFESFVLDWLARRDVAWGYIHFIPQANLVKSSRGRVEMDVVGRFESLAGDFERVACALGRPAALESHNRTKNRRSQSYRESYTSKSAEVVARLYREDIETFGYEF